MINGTMLRDAVISGAANILNRKKSVDELNVFPVPDGDTGTNMSMTIGSAARELQKLPADPTVSQTAEAVSSALLRGARGNSGVILSLLFRGIAKGLAGLEEADGKALSAALKAGVEAAYKAVMKPTEGTILTVARVAAERCAVGAAEQDAISVFKTALEGAREALATTPELLPVLKKAGVVDAGGQGLVIIFEGMLHTFLTGEILTAEDASEMPAATTGRNAAGEFDEEINFTYCTEFIVSRAKGNTLDPLRIRAFLETIGDSLVFVEDEQIIKVHVHTDDPGRALQEGQKYGQLVNIKIENMRDQHERARHESRTAMEESAQSGIPYTPVEPEQDYGFVAVAAGEGLRTLFHDLGVNEVVSGGQTMNPSTEDLLRAIEQTPARTVFVLPNNKNIIMAAEQAVPLASRNVIVIHTRTIPMGISAMLAFDPDSDSEQNAIAMRDASSKVATGEITFAARDSDFDDHKIKKGEIMAMAGGKIAFTEHDLIRAAARLAKLLVKKDTAFFTLIYGSDVTDEQAEEAQKAIAEKIGPAVEITLINGGQPVYYFIMSAE